MAQAGIATSVTLGIGLSQNASHPIPKLEGVLLAGYGSALSCLAWGIGSALKGDKAKALKCFAAATALSGVTASVDQAENDFIKQSSESPSTNYYDLEDALSMCRAEGFNKEHKIAALNADIKFWNQQYAEKSTKLFRAETNADTETELGQKNRERIASLTSDKVRLENQLAKANTDLAKAEVSYNKAKQKYSKLRNQCVAAKSVGKAQLAELADVKNDLANKQQALEQCAKKVDACKTTPLTPPAPVTPPVTNTQTTTATKEHKYNIIFGATYLSGNPERDELSRLVDTTHKEYADRWGITHRVVDQSLLKKECTLDNRKVDCVPYWNKVAVLRNWLKEPAQSSKQEWYILADDDMPVTDMTINPSEAIDMLRRGKDTSIIVARDVVVWTGDEKTSVNTGLLFIRKDEHSRKFIEKLWERRNDHWSDTNQKCRTLGTCVNQDSLHEQEGMARVIKNDKSLLNKVVTLVLPRENYVDANGKTKELAINTFNRHGCFLRDNKDWKFENIDYSNCDAKYLAGAWRPGDWLGQTAGVPIKGWYCGDYDPKKPNGPINPKDYAKNYQPPKQPGPIRYDRLTEMICQTVR